MHGGRLGTAGCCGHVRSCTLRNSCTERMACSRKGWHFLPWNSA